ncbi:hypothetical protein EKQ61_01425 [Staphylococcus gallinarum]|uniref:Uncharacterized protein n=1 Tax=Staphylococcus gallinarum TaxID=1293 RepID=A0A0D0SEL2_STAGA|nr:hypothetical protein SH09_10800 [Staphylococcus gallinarum]RTX82854.1 hypothetical protein EKQ61_01425 [Staphylococcus gallinarum]GEQ04536.1 hypothetical protein SGA02_03640 [Staphylococcus gallinarum]SUM32085.1 Uncharacterised protein [Staphylococcus gallinarum]
MNDIKSLKSEKEVLDFLFGLIKIEITKTNIESISSMIYEMMLKHPTATSWFDFRFAVSEENKVLAELISVNEKNLESVMLRKYREDARKTRKALLGYCEMEPLYTPE